MVPDLAVVRTRIPTGYRPIPTKHTRIPRKVLPTVDGRRAPFGHARSPVGLSSTDWSFLAAYGGHGGDGPENTPRLVRSEGSRCVFSGATPQGQTGSAWVESNNILAKTSHSIHGKRDPGPQLIGSVCTKNTQSRVLHDVLHDVTSSVRLDR